MGAYNRRNTRARRQVWSYFGPVHWGGAGEGGEDMLHTRRMMFAGTVSAIALGMAAPAYAQDTTGAATANQGEAPNEIVVTGIRASLEAARAAKRKRKKRESGLYGKRGSERVDLGGRGANQTKHTRKT